MIEYQSLEPAHLWYLVGLIAADGCLSRDGRHIDITAKDRQFLESLAKKLKISNSVCKKRNGSGKIQYRIQISSSTFHAFLKSVGLVSRKSLVLNRIAVEEQHFNDFLRGVIDGDGSIRSWKHPSNGGWQWSLRIYSASFRFLRWLQQEIKIRFLTDGGLHEDRKLFVLKFGKMAAQRILKQCYYSGSLSLQRKERLALECVNTANGWSTSKTIGQVAERQTLRTQWVSLAATLG